MKFLEREETRKKIVRKTMCDGFTHNLNYGVRFLNYAVSRVKVGLMKGSEKKRVKNYTFDHLKTPQKYNLRKYGF